MIRFFYSPAPRFKSYANPSASSVEQSPYYFWWLALTLHKGYVDACANSGAGYEQLYADFGDVRYEGNKHKAFCDWWRGKMPNDEPRGVYLFAEPLTGVYTRAIETVEDAADAIANPKVVLISIPLASQMQYVERNVAKILRRHREYEMGRRAHNPSLSKARYSMSKAVLPTTMKVAFDVYEMGLKADQLGKAIHSTTIADKLKLKISKSKITDEADSVENYKIKVSATVSRYKRQARQMIDNVGRGEFP